MSRWIPLIFVTSCIGSAGLVACGGDDPAVDRDLGDADTTLEVFLPDSVDFDTSNPGDTAPDTTPDITPGCSSFGCPCGNNADCDSGICLESADGLVCSLVCFAECPSGYECRQVTSLGPESASVCVPRHTRLCRPCRTHSECQSPTDADPAYCLPATNPEPEGSAGSFCGSSCLNRPCPDGYDCEDVEVDGATARQCVPRDGLCDCRPSWAGRGFSTDCDVTNTFGTCVGSRGCEANGLSACVGPQPAPELCDELDNDCNGATDDLPATACYVTTEVGTCPGLLVCDGDTPVCQGQEALSESCNGQDDDCDGQTDEQTCDDGLLCTTDACAAPFQCVNALLPGNCLIDGACHIGGQYNPNNPCQLCDPTRTSSLWSQAPNTCLIGDACYPANAVNPLNACQICQPNQSPTGWSQVANSCQIAGVCYGPGEANPDNPCEICVPAASTSTWSQAQNTCNIQGQCFAAGPRPDNPCQVCDPTRNATGWVNAPTNTLCDDGNACSAQSTCDGSGVCVGNTSCDDGVACTFDACNPQTGCDHSVVTPGYCRINGVCYTTNTANPNNPCERCNPTQSTTSWSPQPTSVGCNDGLYCTVNDRCNGAGQCVGEARSCGDALTCTTDTCNEQTDQCVNSLQASQCVIAGTCYSNGTTQPNNVCYRCNSANTTSNWSLNNGAACNDGNACTASDSCSNGTCAGTNILDADEPNNTRAAAKSITSFSDCEYWDDRRSRTATLHPSGDEDWYTFRVTDITAVFGCGSTSDPNPRVRLSGMPAGQDYDLCLYFQCDGGATLDIEEREGVLSTFEGLSGVCSTNVGTLVDQVRIYADCLSRTDDTGTAYVRIFRKTGGPSCETYTLEWGQGDD